VSKATKRERQRQNREARRLFLEREAKKRRRIKTTKQFLVIAVVVAAIIGIVTLVTGPTTKAAATCVQAKPGDPKTTSYPSAPTFDIQPDFVLYRAEMDTTCGKLTIQLDPKQAPQTVNSFAFLAREHFYDGLSFHRVVKDFVVQGGDPKGDGTGDPGYSLPDEPPANGYTKYSVAMANSGSGTSGSQFFIATTDKAGKTLDGDGPPYKYSILGTVTKGFGTVKRMNALGSTSQDLSQQQPKRTILINKVTIVESPAPISTTTTTNPS
jgi:cyclophilin family peptidyl-prolyl cis-trans isomerase